MDSSKRVSDTSSAFIFVIPFFGAQYDSVVEMQISVPKSWYLIIRGSKFTVIQGLNGYPLELDAGNYTLIFVLDCLRTKLATIGLLDGLECTVGWPSSTQPQTDRITFSVNPILPVSFRFDMACGIPGALGFEIGSENLLANGI